MRYKKTAAALSLMSLSAMLAACDVITAQHIPNSTTTAFNNGAGLGGRDAQMGMPGSFADGGGLGGMIDGVVDEAFDADIVGRIVKVSGSSVELERMKQSSSSQKDQARSTGGAADGNSGWTSTGETLTLTLGTEVRVLSGSSTPRQGGRPQGTEGRGSREAGSGNSAGGSAADHRTDGSAASSDGKVSDLKAGQFVWVWYKEGSKTVDRIRILQDGRE